MKEDIIPSHIMVGNASVPNPEYAKARYEIRCVDRYGKIVECYPFLRTNDPELLVKLEAKKKHNHKSTT